MLWTTVEVSALITGACAITYRPLFNWIFQIQPPSAAFGVRTTSASAINEAGTNTGIASHSDVGGDIKMQVRGVFQSPLSSSPIHSSRIVGTEDGFHRMRDSTEV